MQHPKNFLIVNLVILLFSSCCLGTPDCLPPYLHQAQLRFVSASGGSDLLFGQTSTYDRRRISFFSLKGNDTIFFPVVPIKVNQTGYDSVLQVDFSPANEMAYIRLSNGDIDTMQLSYRTNKKSSCCAASSELTKIIYNNSVELNLSSGIQEIKK